LKPVCGYPRRVSSFRGLGNVESAMHRSTRVRFQPRSFGHSGTAAPTNNSGCPCPKTLS
jgi:hypothetical protein